jgi:hypothetical protein
LTAELGSNRLNKNFQTFPLKSADRREKYVSKKKDEKGPDYHHKR